MARRSAPGRLGCRWRSCSSRPVRKRSRPQTSPLSLSSQPQPGNRRRWLAKRAKCRRRCCVRMPGHPCSSLPVAHLPQLCEAAPQIFPYGAAPLLRPGIVLGTPSSFAHGLNERLKLDPTASCLLEIGGIEVTPRRQRASSSIRRGPAIRKLVLDRLKREVCRVAASQHDFLDCPRVLAHA